MARTTTVILPLLLGFSGCGGCGPDLEVCAVATRDEPVTFGDANGDGHVDIADGVFIQRASSAGGPQPACDEAVDFTGIGRGVDTTHAAEIWYYLFTGTVPELPALEEGVCVAPGDVGASPGCAHALLQIDAPAEVNGDFTATVTLETEGIALGPEAWSYSVVADGCAITDATIGGTDASSTIAAGGGLSFDRTDATEAGNAVSAVVLGWLKPVGLTPTGDPRSIASLEISVTVPASGCTVCSLSFSDEVRGRGRAVETVISFEGWRYRPDVLHASVDVCAG